MAVFDKAQIASYPISELIAQNMKAHTLGEVCQYDLGNKAAMKISKIPMSNDTIHMGF